MNNIEILDNQKLLKGQQFNRDKYTIHLEHQLMKITAKYEEAIRQVQNEKQCHEQYRSNHLLKISEQVSLYKKKYENLYNNYMACFQNCKQHQNHIKRLKEEKSKLKDKLIKNEDVITKLQLQCFKYKKILSQLKVQNHEFMETISELEKNELRIKMDNEELKDLLQNQVNSAKFNSQRMRDIFKRSITHNNQLIFSDQKHQQATFYKSTCKIMYNPQTMEKQLINSYENQWCQDMRKLKNCIDCGSTYLSMLDPSNLDMMISRQILNFIKKTIKNENSLKQQLSLCHIEIEKQREEMKNILEAMTTQLNQISSQKVPLKMDITIQTQKNEQQFVIKELQKKILGLNKLNSKLKIKNHYFFTFIEKLILYAAGLHQIISNINEKIHYYSIFEMSYFHSKLIHESSNCKKKILKQKVRKVLFSIYFIKILEANVRVSRSKISERNPINSNKNKFSQIFRKPLYFLKKNQCMQINNIPLLKIKDSPESQELQDQSLVESVGYCCHKIKQINENNNDCVRLKQHLWKFVLYACND